MEQQFDLVPINFQGQHLTQIKLIELAMNCTLAQTNGAALLR